MRSTQLRIATLNAVMALSICSFVIGESAGAADAPPTSSTPSPSTALMTRALPEFPGKEAIMLTVELAPGAKSPAHRHDAHVFVYVLEGAVTMQVEGGVPATIKAGETFYENPNDIHVMSANASQIQKAKFLVVMIKDAGKPASRLVTQEKK